MRSLTVLAALVSLTLFAPATHATTCGVDDDCTTTAKSCRAKYDAGAQKLVAKGSCPACLDGAHQSALADRVVDEAESETRDVYCSGTVPLP